MQRESWTWNSTRLAGPARVVRWGHFGTPVVLFPSAGGDCEEVERFQLVAALHELIDAGRIKVFSVDGIAARTWLRGTSSPEECVRVQAAFNAFIDAELVPLIRRDCQSDTLELIAAGAALGAYSAVAALCRLPSVFRVAIGLSGVYDLSKYLTGGFTPLLNPVSPLHSVAALGQAGADARADALRKRFVLLASGEGDYETPAESQRMAAALDAGRFGNRLELWGSNFAHSWNTWREMLPRYVGAHA